MQPNILFIILDTLRRDRLSSYGYHEQTSPCFDAFASESTLFERAVAPAQWTIPSHASMFTGTYPSVHQLTQADHQLSGALPTIAEILQVEGYKTAAFCNNPLLGILNTGLQRGFDEFYNYAGAAPNRPQGIQRSWLRKAVARRWRRFARTVSNKFAHSDRLFRASLHPMLTPIWTHSVNYKGHTERSISDVIDYISARDGCSQPHFTFLNLMGTHLPYRPPQDYLPPSIKNNPAAYKMMNRFNADAARWASPAVPPLNPDEQHVIDTFYNAEIKHQDQHLGRLLDYLWDSGALDNTMVIISADHGEGHGDHRFFGHSFVVYQELVHVPLLIYYPAQYPISERIKTNISTRRLFHTILDATHVTPPLDEADPNADVKSLSLRNAIEIKTDSEKGMVISEAYPPTTLLNVIKHRTPELIHTMQLTQIRRGAYHGDHKLTMVGQAVEGLFNVADDPFEVHNLAAQPNTEDLQQMLVHFTNQALNINLDSSNITQNDIHVDVIESLRALGYID